MENEKVRSWGATSAPIWKGTGYFWWCWHLLPPLLAALGCTSSSSLSLLRTTLRVYLGYRRLCCILQYVFPQYSLFVPPLFLSRSPRSATPPQLRNWATTPAMTSSPAWCHRTPTRPRPWWTSSRRWSGTTCPRSPRRATTARAAWRPSYRSPEKQVGALCPSAAHRRGESDVNWPTLLWLIDVWWFAPDGEFQYGSGTLSVVHGVATQKSSVKSGAILSMMLTWFTCLHLMNNVDTGFWTFFSSTNRSLSQAFGENHQSSWTDMHWLFCTLWCVFWEELLLNMARRLFSSSSLKSCWSKLYDSLFFSPLSATLSQKIRCHCSRIWMDWKREQSQRLRHREEICKEARRASDKITMMWCPRLTLEDDPWSGAFACNFRAEARTRVENCCFNLGGGGGGVFW